MQRHSGQLIAAARRHSANAADAEDAYQRALEKFLTKAPDIEEDEQLAAWLSVVTRNEALMIQRSNKHRAPTDFEQIAERWVAEDAGPEERLLNDEFLDQGREALGRLDPAQTRCLLLRADGLGYDEICEITGFSYAKVNRCLTEGRKGMRTRVGMIAAGAECQRLEPMLSLYADGLADEHSAEDLRLHLGHCLACQATLRDFKAAPRRLALALPLGGMVSQHWWDGLAARTGESWRNVFDGLQERLFGQLAAGQQTTEIAFAKKAAIVGAVAVSLTAGTAGVTKVVASDEKQDAPAEQQQAGPTGATDAVVAPPQDVPAPAGAAKPKEEEAPRKSKDEDVVAPHRSAPEAADTQAADEVQGQNPAAAEPIAPEPPPAAEGGGDGSAGGFAP